MRVKLFIPTSIIAILLGLGCAKLPFSKKIKVAKTPAPSHYATINNKELLTGSPAKKAWWIVLSSQSGNNAQVSSSNDMLKTKVGFLEPFIVLKRSGNFLKLAKYDATIDLVESKGKIKNKGLKIIGWIHESKLLLWLNALKNKENYFEAKAITNVANTDIMKSAEKYFGNDSLLLYNSPDLTERLSKKIQLGQIIYIYKQADDKKSYLVGNAPFTTIDSAKQNILGWISVNAVSLWGERAALTFVTDSNQNFVTGKMPGLYSTIEKAQAHNTMPDLPEGDINDRSNFENIFPLQVGSENSKNVASVNYLGNVLDYSKNKVYNVLGRPIYFDKYKEILHNASKLNVVFVIDGSDNNKLYMPSVKSVMQDLQLYFDSTYNFKSTKFGAVMYKQNKCDGDNMPNTRALTNNYTDIVKFIDEKLKVSECSDADIYQPLNKGLLEACKLLNPVKNETNIIIVVGATGSSYTDNINLSDVVSGILKVQARLLFCQTISKTGDAYNDFILAAEKIVLSSSQSIAELKKEKLVSQDDVILSAVYNLKVGDSGIYYLDFPEKSMSQGFVVYPKKGEAILPSVLKKSFDSLLNQVIQDNDRVAKSLQTYFKSNVGVNSTEVKQPFTNLFKNAPSPLPSNFASAFINVGNGFLLPAYLPKKNEQDPTDSIPTSRGILLTGTEYDKLALDLQNIYTKSGVGNEKFNRNKAIKSYQEFIKEYSQGHKKVKMSTIQQLSTAKSFELFTGYALTDSLSNTTTLKKLKNKNSISKKTVIDFFNRYKRISELMIENKNTPRVRIDCKGTFFYWLSDKVLN